MRNARHCRFCSWGIPCLTGRAAEGRSLWSDRAAPPAPITPASPSLGLSPNFIADAAAKAAPAVVSIVAQPANCKQVWDLVLGLPAHATECLAYSLCAVLGQLWQGLRLSALLTNPVHCTRPSAHRTTHAGMRLQAEAGSGFVVRADGTIVTSLQVVQQCLSARSPPGKPLRNARPVSVALQDGRRLEGRIIAIDRCIPG